MWKHRTEIHLGQSRHHGLRQSWDTLDLGLLVQCGRTLIEMRQRCLHAGSLLLPLFELRLLLLRREANAGKSGRASSKNCALLLDKKNLIADRRHSFSAEQTRYTSDGKHICRDESIASRSAGEYACPAQPIRINGH